jgi:hypothetical protein
MSRTWERWWRGRAARELYWGAVAVERKPEGYGAPLLLVPGQTEVAEVLVDEVPIIAARFVSQWRAWRSLLGDSPEARRETRLLAFRADAEAEVVDGFNEMLEWNGTAPPDLPHQYVTLAIED